MKKLLLTFAILVIGIISITGQSTVGFNYQAVVRDASGEIVADQNIRMRISLLKGSVSGDVVLQEVFTPTTNEFGLVNIVIGSQNTEVFVNIDWPGDDYFVKVEVDITGGTTYTTMGTSQLLSVPYAQYAFSAGEWKNVNDKVYTLKNVGIGTSTPSGRLKVVENDDAKDDVPIFEVVNNNGETVFAVYNNRVEINFEDDGSDKARGGFAVSGRTSTKDEFQQLFTVNSNETRVFVDDSSDDKARGGFAVSGRTSTKEESPQNFLHVQPGSTHIFFDQSLAKSDKARGGFAVSGRTSTKEATEDIFLLQPGFAQIFVDETTDPLKARGGFAVSGRTSTKNKYDDIFVVQPGLTQVFVDETTSKARGGFAVSGRTSTKDDGIYDVLAVSPERTDIFINPSSEKFFDDGFSISLYDDLFDHTELFAVSDLGAVVNVGMAIAPRISTSDVNEDLIAETSAVAGGRVYEYGGTSIEYRGVVYSVDPRPHQTVEIDLENPPTNLEHSGWVLHVDAGFGEFDVTLLGLAPGTTYYVSAFAINEDELVGFGPVKSFTTVTPPGSAVFNVTDDGGAPLMNIGIEIYEDPDFGILFDNNITNEFGVAQFEVMPAGTWYYKAIDDYYYEYQTVEGTIVVESAEATIEDVIMPEFPKHEVTFVVKDESGELVEGADVYLYFAGTGGDDDKGGNTKPTEPLYTLTDENGVAVFEEVPEGYYTYYVGHSDVGSFSMEEPIYINENMTIEVTIVPN